jgi:hypothetical protein
MDNYLHSDYIMDKYIFEIRYKKNKNYHYIDFIFIFRREMKNINLIEVMRLIHRYGMYHGVRLGEIFIFAVLLK